MKPFTGEIEPLTPEESRNFKPFDGELAPLEQEIQSRQPEMITPTQEIGGDGRIPANLPDPTPDMFQQMSLDDAIAFRNAYERHPRSQKSWTGEVEYNGKR